MRKACLAALGRAVAQNQAARHWPPCCSFTVCSGGTLSPSGSEAQAAVRGRLRTVHLPAFLHRYSTDNSHGNPRHDLVAVFTCGQCGKRSLQKACVVGPAHPWATAEHSPLHTVHLQAPGQQSSSAGRRTTRAL